MSTVSALAQPSLTVVLAYAPAGLGHLRVTYALRKGLPEEVHPVLFLSGEGSVHWLHRVTSIHPWAKKIFEWFQYGKQEELQSAIIHKFLLQDAKEVEEKLLTLSKQQVDVPETLLIVATHFGIAQQVAQCKASLERRAHVRVKLVVQVTDDSPQRVWFVPQADLLVVPSERTKESFVRYAAQNKLPLPPMEVLPYPVSPELTTSLSKQESAHRKEQYDPHDKKPIHWCVPISGAAVGTSYLYTIMKKLHRSSSRHVFHVIAKKSLYTQMFLQSLERKNYITLSSSHSDRQIIELYEETYTNQSIGFEITKPSEQAFKALCSSGQRGGAILLFAPPVGRQEYDNLAFLSRHNLIPNQDDQQALYEYAAAGLYAEDILTRVQERAKIWRGLVLPPDAQAASTFILWAYKAGVFASMGSCQACAQVGDLHPDEVRSDGVARFWKAVERLVA